MSTFGQMKKRQPADGRQMKRLLIVNFAQFGYHTDTYMYCKYLKEEYAITYLCWDYGYPRITEDGVHVIHLTRQGSLIQRMIRFLVNAAQLMKETEFDIVFVVYFRMCSMVRFLGRYKRIILDIRTGYVKPGWLKRKLYNGLILLESLAFPTVSVITEELRKVLGIAKRKSHILPLGAEKRNSFPKEFKTMNLFYVGTLTARDIYKTVQGFDRFAAEFAERIEISYDIVGSGSPEAEELLAAAISSARFSHLIRTHGLVPHKLLDPFFERCNIGVVYVPIVVYQQPQPYTKTFEYLLAGMPVLATANATNLKVINSANGVLVTDSSEGVYTGLKKMVGQLHNYDSERIKEESGMYTWAAIITENLRPFLESLAHTGGRGRLQNKELG